MGPRRMNSKVSNFKKIQIIHYPILCFIECSTLAWVLTIPGAYQLLCACGCLIKRLKPWAQSPHLWSGGSEMTYLIECCEDSTVFNTVPRKRKCPVIGNIAECFLPIRMMLSTSVGRNLSLAAFLVSVSCVVDAASIPQGQSHMCVLWLAWRLWLGAEKS